MWERVLLVEGKDDLHVMTNLFEVRNVPDTFQVRCPGSEPDEIENGGVDKLLDSIPYRLASSELERLAVVVDANDKGPGAGWDAIRQRLAAAGHDGVPKAHSPEGTIVELSLRPGTPRSVRFGVWIMPDNRSLGMLEDFFAGLIREDDEMIPFVDRFLGSIPTDQRRFVPAHQPKARVHSWLAVSERPGRPMGQAIKADRQLDANSPAVEPFLKWINDALITDGESP